jgi:hypothetical protein
MSRWLLVLISLWACTHESAPNTPPSERTSVVVPSTARPAAPDLQPRPSPPGGTAAASTIGPATMGEVDHPPRDPSVEPGPTSQRLPAPSLPAPSLPAPILTAPAPTTPALAPNDPYPVVQPTAQPATSRCAAVGGCVAIGPVVDELDLDRACSEPGPGGVRTLSRKLNTRLFGKSATCTVMRFDRSPCTVQCTLFVKATDRAPNRRRRIGESARNGVALARFETLRRPTRTARSRTRFARAIA